MFGKCFPFSRPSQERVLGFLTLVIAITFHVAGKYRDWWWYDNVAHLSAGITIGSTLSTDASTTGQDIAVGTAISLLWEFSEYMADVRPWDDSIDPDSDWAAEDTVLDTVFFIQMQRGNPPL